MGMVGLLTVYYSQQWPARCGFKAAWSPFVMFCFKEHLVSFATASVAADANRELNLSTCLLYDDANLSAPQSIQLCKH